MAAIDDLKAKLVKTATFLGGNKTAGYGGAIGGAIGDFSPEEWELYFTGELAGTFDVLYSQTSQDLLANPWEDKGDYRLAFEAKAKQEIVAKSYENLSYNQVRYAVEILDEDSEEYAKVIENLNVDDLGVLFDDFTFNKFDVAVSLKLNELFQSGGTVQLDKLPIFVFDGSVGEAKAKYSIKEGFVTTDRSVELAPDLYDEIVEVYATQNGSIITTQTSNVGIDSDVTINGNISNNNQDFQYLLARPINLGVFSWINDRFLDFKTPASILDSSFKSFLINSLSFNSNAPIQSQFNDAIKACSNQLLFYLMYDFESARRIGVLNAAIDLPEGTSAEDILAAAETQALEDINGLTGEGGITQTLDDNLDVEERQRFFQQCVLMALMDELRTTFDDSIEANAQSSEEGADDATNIHKNGIYEERFYMVSAPGNKNSRLMNFIMSPSGEAVNDFLNMTPDIQAFLTPKIRLYKVFNEMNGDLKQVEFIFKNSTDGTEKLKQLFADNDKYFRGSGFGIKDFSFSFNGTTPATAKNDITANLTLFFQDFSDFVQEFESTEGKFKFVDLILYDKKNEDAPTYGYATSHPEQYSPAYYRIRADVGWQVPEANEQFDAACNKRGLDADNIRTIIEKTNQSYYLNMVEHDLNFKADGTVEIKAEYRGYIESALKGSDMDALVDDVILADRKSREASLKTAIRDCSASEVARIKRIYSAQEQLLVEELYQRTYARLSDLGKIKTANVNSDGGFRKNGYFKTKPSLLVGTELPEAPSENEIPYFFLGDLLYVMLDIVYSTNNPEPIKNMKLVLPSIDFTGFFEGDEPFSINIAQIPISQQYFTEWFTKQIIDKQVRSKPIMYFLRELLNELVSNALIDVCLNRSYKKSMNFQTTTINASNDPLYGKPTATAPIVTLDSGMVPFSVEESADINDITSYVMVYPSYSTTRPMGSGDYNEDILNGLYHFHLGQDRGIIHEVKFSKVDMQYIREARYLRNGIDGLLQLGAVYRATLSMFGNTMFYPGMQLYINPFGLGGEQFLPNKENTIANKLGLGGYHIIEKVNSSITSGLFKTTVEAMFVYSGDGDTTFDLQGKNDTEKETDIEAIAAQEARCVELVGAVETQYRSILAGQEDDGRGIAEAVLESNAENLREAGNRIRESTNGAVNLTLAEAAEADPEVSTTGIPNTGINLGFSPEDLLGDTE